MKKVTPKLFLVCIFIIFWETKLGEARWRRQSCSSKQFRCQSGQCIASFLMCDGESNCADGTDETTQTCTNIRCPNFAFRCAYGGCIDGAQKCDGKKNCADGSDELDCKEAAKSTDSVCKQSQFQCKSKTCIDPFLLCDGNPDCDDGSDETEEICGGFVCPKYTFRCKYGACISEEGMCNGKKQCADKSDESADICGKITTAPPVVPVPSQAGCLLPDHPVNGHYEITGCNHQSCSKNPGLRVPGGTILRFRCKEGLALSGSELVACDNKWSASFPSCGKERCSPIALPSREIDCVLNGQVVDCTKPVAPGTRAVVRCSAEYTQIPEFSSFDTRCQENGKWSREITACTPKCGEPNPMGLPLVAHGSRVKMGQYPWHAGIYRSRLDGSMEQVCGGTVVSSRAIVTAAHCFWNGGINKAIDYKPYKIALGKYYREWNRKTNYVVIKEIEKVEIYERFIGDELRYAHDIAVVIVKEEIKMSKAIRPICVDYGKTYLNYFTPGEKGIVIGWGFTETNEQSETLQMASLPYVDFKTCKEEVPASFLPYLTFDKFCAGYHNGTSVCKGDSGGGYATKYDQKWYLTGIVSLGVPSENSDDCNIFQYSAFTKVSEYYEFLRTCTQ